MASQDKAVASRYVPDMSHYFYPEVFESAVLTCACSGKDATPSNPRGIPYAPFVDKVEDYVASREDVEPTLRKFQEMIS